MDVTERARISLFAGHSPRLTGVPEIDRLPIITLLRDPVEQVKSHCQHVSAGKTPYWRQLYPPGTFELDDFLESGHLVLLNLQSRMLLGDRDHRAITGDTAALVDEALHVLQNDIECFGIVEEFDTSLMLFRRRLGWEQWPACRQLNVTSESRRLVFSSSQIAKIGALNAVDIQVYEGALRLFREQTAAMWELLQTDLTEFKAHQAARSPHQAPRAPSVWRRLSMNWPGRIGRGARILRTGSWDELRAEMQQFLHWLRA
jgi:hypothetical protein